MMNQIDQLIAPFLPRIKAAILQIEQNETWFRNYQRNKWVQEIKTNHRRNKRKSSRCRKSK